MATRARLRRASLNERISRSAPRIPDGPEIGKESFATTDDSAEQAAAVNPELVERPTIRQIPVVGAMRELSAENEGPANRPEMDADAADKAADIDPSDALEQPDTGADRPQSAGPAGRAAIGTTAGEEASLGTLRGGMPAPLRGSLASLERQNDRVEADGLERIEDENDLAARIADKLLVPVPASLALTVNGNLPENHRYCRPWTARFLSDLAREHAAVFHSPLEVSSAVRTVEYQKHLMRINGNAAAAEGDVASPHLTGATVDIAKSGLTRKEIAWMRERLEALQAAEMIDVEEEFRQSCFHITVYKSYAPAAMPRQATPGSPNTEKPLRHSDPGAGTDTAAQGI